LSRVSPVEYCPRRQSSLQKYRPVKQKLTVIEVVLIKYSTIVD